MVSYIPAKEWYKQSAVGMRISTKKGTSDMDDEVYMPEFEPNTMRAEWSVRGLPFH